MQKGAVTSLPINTNPLFGIYIFKYIKLANNKRKQLLFNTKLFDYYLTLFAQHYTIMHIQIKFLNRPTH